MKRIHQLTQQILPLSFFIILLASACDGRLPTEAVLDKSTEADQLNANAPASPNASPWIPDSVVPVASFDASQGELPEGIAIDRFGRIYVGLAPRGEICRIESNGSCTIVASFTLNPGDNGVLGLNFDRQGTLYAVVSSSNPDVHGIWSIAPDGTKERLAGTENIGFPNDVTFDVRGNVYISDSSGGAIWRVPRGGTAEVWMADATLEGTGAFGLPISIGANGIVFVPGKRPPARQNMSPKAVGGLVVANTEKGLLAYIPIDPDGRAWIPHVLASGPALFGLDGIRLDATGHIYGAVNAQNKIVRIDPDDGSVSTIADTGFDFPASLAFGKKRDRHTLFITNYAIFKVLNDLPNPEPGVVKRPVGPPGRGNR